MFTWTWCKERHHCWVIGSQCFISVLSSIDANALSAVVMFRKEKLLSTLYEYNPQLKINMEVMNSDDVAIFYFIFLPSTPAKLKITGINVASRVEVTCKRPTWWITVRVTHETEIRLQVLRSICKSVGLMGRQQPARAEKMPILYTC